MTALGPDVEPVTAAVVDVVVSVHTARGSHILDVPLLEVRHVSLAADTATAPL